MPIPTPFHPRTSALCTSLRWTDWAGYYAVSFFDHSHENEYFAFRHAAGLIDVTPLFKYEVRGPEAASFLAAVMTRDITKMKVGQVAYACWCDDAGKVIDDGTVFCLADDHFRVAAAEPMLAWFGQYIDGFKVSLEDWTAHLAVLAIQGPTSRGILERVSDLDLEVLKYFHLARGRVQGLAAWVSRTGYTGDLGYEVWVENKDALALWDALMSAGQDFGLRPCGLDALDVARVEAGYIMNGVDFFSAHLCLTEARKASPFELGLGWLVDLDREPFVGQEALRAEKARGSKTTLVGLELNWEEQAALFERHGLPAQVSPRAWRTGVPVYGPGSGRIGQATSGSWSPILKKNLALASVETAHAVWGREVKIEFTVEYERHKVAATVVRPPFYDPEQKRS